MKSYNSTLLKSVEKPGRYAGGEYGAIIKDKSAICARVAFCFPDTYEIGMSNLGVRILYGALNQSKDIWCERVYTPWTDMMKKMEEERLPLCALESGDPIGIFDFIAFTLQYEMSYTNVLQMLKLAGLPLRAKDRTEDMPIVIGGGPCAYNPEPIADFFDLFNIGEGEEMLPQIVRLYVEMQKNGTYNKTEFLHRAAREIQGVYVPAFYDITYNDDGTIREIRPIYDDIPKQVTKTIVKDLDKCYFPDKVVLPYIETVHDRIMLEVYRGCIRGCRFCQAGMIYRPVREKSPDVLNEQAKKIYQNSGYPEISLSSLSISDYTGLEPLCDKLLSWTDENMVSLSLPSLRVDSFSQRLMDKIDSVRSSSLTFAPEAGTQRMRNVINKNVTEEDVLRATKVAFDSGKTNVKLYFINGLPTETDEDIKGIAELAQKVVDSYYENPNHQKRPCKVTISVACLIPKPFTAFQWERQDTMEELERKQEYLKSCIHSKHIVYQHHDAKTSVIEAVLARGNRRLSDALELACNEGFCFDAWEEYFDFDKWVSVMERTGIDYKFFSNRAFDTSEILPWDIIDCGVTKNFFKKEREKAYRSATTPNCREQCSNCGANKLGGERAVCPGCQNHAFSIPELAKSVEEKHYPPVEGKFKTVRIQFKKTGNLQYSSHLDLQRTMGKILTRAKIPMWYTEGFNPHPKITFGLPLSVGAQGDCEYIDLRIIEEMPCNEIKKRLNRELTDEMQVSECYIPKTDLSDIGWAEWEMELNENGIENKAEAVLKMLNQKPFVVQKKTKAGVKDSDISDWIRNVSVRKGQNKLVVKMLLKAGNNGSLNPEVLVTALREQCNLFSGDFTSYDYQLIRHHAYLEDGETQFK